MTTFEALIKNRRSIRKYLDKAVETEKVDAILRTALMSPASKRANGWEFIVVDQREILVKLAACREFGSKFIAEAPLAIVVAYDAEKSDVWYEDASISAILIQLAAADLDLGSCWVQVHNRQFNITTTSEEYVKNILQMPDNRRILCMLTIGYKNEERKPYDEEKLLYNKIHHNQY